MLPGPKHQHDFILKVLACKFVFSRPNINIKRAITNEHIKIM